MSDLVAIVYPSVQQAEAMREKIIGLQREYLIELGDAVVAEKLPGGNVKLHQMMNLTAAGAFSGSLWGALVGMIFLMPLAGAVVGAASGALGGALSDYGIEDKFMKDVAGATKPGDAVLFLLIRKMTADRVLDAVRGSGGVVLRTSFDNASEQKLRDALNGVSAPAAQPASPAA
jgi:uncharacterized membrane protein